MRLVYLKYDIKYFLHNMRYWRKLSLGKAKKRNSFFIGIPPFGLIFLKRMLIQHPQVRISFFVM